jgi:hypothetical protein
MTDIPRNRPAIYDTAHVLMIAPNDFRFNSETSGDNAFQHAPVGDAGIGSLAETQHRALRALLIDNGVIVTLHRADHATPDAPFCNNWFSTHPAMKGLRDAQGIMEEDVPQTVVLYPLLAPNRRIERRPELVEGLLRRMYPRMINMAHHEERGRFLESTGSLCMHDARRTVYAAISQRTDPGLAAAWAEKMGYRLVAFHSTDATGKPYYHTNVMMYIGHDLGVVCLESIGDASERATVEEALAESGLEVMAISRAQVGEFCGNALTLTNNRGERLLVMSTRAWENYSPAQQAVLERHCRVLHTDLSAFEQVGGGSARCLIGELY